MLLWLLLFHYVCVNAQVTIGSSFKPKEGTLLDLKEESKLDGTPNSTKGLILPRVMLTDKNNLYPMFEGSASGVPNSNYDTSTEKDAEDLLHIGLTVYNMNFNPQKGFCKGVYVWQGKEWLRMEEECVFPSITLDKVTDRVLTTGTTLLTATSTPSNAVKTWTSSDPTIASVDANGLVTTLKQGNVRITASITSDGNIFLAACDIQVRDFTVTINESNIRLVTGTTMTPTITISPSWANVSTTVWSNVSGTSATINSASGLITPAANIATPEGETSRVRVTLSSGVITASDETNVLAATLRLNTKRATKNLISRAQDKNNVNSNSQYEVSNYTPTWASTLGTVTISDWVSSNTTAATITPSGVMTATTSFPGNGTKTNTRTTTVSGGKVTLVASATYGGSTIATPVANSCNVTVYSVNPYQITDTRANDTAQTYWTSYFGSVVVNPTTDAVEWDAAGNWWMTENLRAIKYSNGTAIPAAPATGGYDQMKPIYDYPNFNVANRATMGVLYNFPAAYGRAMTSTNEVPSDVNIQGVCPMGWHLPNDAEWEQLGTAIQNNASIYSSLTSANASTVGNAFKAVGTGKDPNIGASNTPSQGGFSVLLVGYGSAGGSYNNFGTYASFWTSTSSPGGSNSITYHRDFSETSGSFLWYGGGRQYIYSVRCIKN